MKNISTIGAIVFFLIGLSLILISSIGERFYRNLGMALPGITEAVIDFGNRGTGYFVIILSGFWLTKNKWLNGERRRNIDYLGLAVGILILIGIVISSIFPFIAADGPISAGT
jgi:hypothetical protein